MNEKENELKQVEEKIQQQVNIISQQIEPIKKDNYELQGIVTNSKNNLNKLQSIQKELEGSLKKIEESGNIKSYYMIPVKDLLRKLEKMVEGGLKMHSEAELKLNKKSSSSARQSSMFKEEMKRSHVLKEEMKKSGQQSQKNSGVYVHHKK